MIYTLLSESSAIFKRLEVVAMFTRVEVVYNIVGADVAVVASSPMILATPLFSMHFTTDE
jgi:hypothetical protein